MTLLIILILCVDIIIISPSLLKEYLFLTLKYVDLATSYAFLFSWTIRISFFDAHGISVRDFPLLALLFKYFLSLPPLSFLCFSTHEILFIHNRLRYSQSLEQGRFSGRIADYVYMLLLGAGTLFVCYSSFYLYLAFFFLFSCPFSSCLLLLYLLILLPIYVFISCLLRSFTSSPRSSDSLCVYLSCPWDSSCTSCTYGRVLLLLWR